MKKYIIALFMLSLFALSDAALAARAVSIDRIPNSAEEFAFMRNKYAGTPDGGATVFIVALLIYTTNKNLGMQCAVLCLDQSRLVEGDTYKGMTPDKNAAAKIALLSEKTKSYIPYSYISRTEPNRDYKAVLPYEFAFMDSDKLKTSDSDADLFVQSSGDKNPRKISLKKNDRGIWKVTNFDAIMQDVAQPVHKKTDDI